MSVTTFGVTAATVPSNRFPHLSGSFGADTAPTSLAVAGMTSTGVASAMERGSGYRPTCTPTNNAVVVDYGGPVFRDSTVDVFVSSYS